MNRACTILALFPLLLAGAIASAQPVARPVDPDKSASSRVVVAMQPVGRIPYDGAVLPLVSPDGRFFATQSGRTPSWDSILAAPGAGAAAMLPPAGLRILMYQLSEPGDGEPTAAPASRRPTLAPVKPAQALPSGLLLGRSADDAGFLVEAPRPPADEGAAGAPTGGRDIGRVRWLSGEIEWLVRDGFVNAHATLSPRGDGAAPASLAYVRRSTASERSELVVRAGDGQIATRAARPGESFAFPCFSPDGRTVGAFTIAPSIEHPLEPPSVHFVAYQVARSELRLELRAIASLDLGRVHGGVHGVYQCVASLQSPPVMPAPVAGLDSSAREMYASGFTLFSPRDAAMLWWMPHEDHLVTMAAGSFAAAPFQHAEFGLLVAGPGLPAKASDRRGGSGSGEGGGSAAGARNRSGQILYQPFRLTKDREPAQPQLGREVAVLASQSIPRATTRPGGISVLIGAPGSGEADALEVLLLAPAQAP